MLKGVNKQVLEITETHNGYFEKAIFFVKPECSGLSEGKLRESARREFESTGKPPERKLLPQHPFKRFLYFGGVFLLGLVIGTAFSALF